MSVTPSFERFDYLIRTNKNIERKLVFDILHAANQRLGFQNHWYLGFGSMWFGDFRMAHRILGIQKMVSIEKEEYAERARFNLPYGSVRVEAGESLEVLKGFSGDEWRHPVIAWLDYDGAINEDVIQDVDLILDKCSVNSVLILTVNGVRNSYRARKATTRAGTSVGVVESFLGSASIAARYQPRPNAAGVFDDLTADIFPEFLSDALLTYMQHKISKSGRTLGEERLQFKPLYQLHHRDGADMVTVGGAVSTKNDLDAWHQCLSINPALFDNGGNPIHNQLDLIPVTLKEKITLDACLSYPCEDGAYIASARHAGLKLSDDELRKYLRYYRHFPIFVETPV